MNFLYCIYFHFPFISRTEFLSIILFFLHYTIPPLPLFFNVYSFFFLHWFKNSSRVFLVYDRFNKIVYPILRPGPRPHLILRHAFHSFSFHCSFYCCCPCTCSYPCPCSCRSCSPSLCPCHCPSSPTSSCHCPSPRALNWTLGERNWVRAWIKKRKYWTKNVVRSTY